MVSGVCSFGRAGFNYKLRGCVDLDGILNIYWHPIWLPLDPLHIP